MKILITGSNGYIGKAVKEHYSEHNLTLLHRAVCELTDESQVDNFFTEKYDVVIHCAALGGNRIERDKPKVLHDNLKMFLIFINIKINLANLFILDLELSIMKTHIMVLVNE